MNENRRIAKSWLNDPDLRQWIAAESAVITDTAISAAFVAYLNNLPWIGPHLDWQKLGGSSLSLADDFDAVTWAHQRRIGQHPYALMVHSPSQPGLAASLEAVMGSIDFLVWKIPGAHYVCGCDSLDPIAPDFEDFVEYDGVEHLIGQ
jgi:hypothetical protein